MDDIDLHWLAGYLEGEGSFLASPPSSPNAILISVQTTDYDIAQKVARIWGGRPIWTGRTQKAHHKCPYIVSLRGRDAAELMRRLHCLMGERRKQQIDTALVRYAGPQRVQFSPEQVEDIRRRAAHESMRAIARSLGVSHTMIQAVVHARGPYSTGA